jgi:hypothetical protein
MGLPAQSIERLREYLTQLPLKAQALLMREFERAVERGENVPVAMLVLEQLRLAVRSTDDNDRYRTDAPSRLMFRPLEPFLIGQNSTLRPGQIRRSSLNAIWSWLAGDALASEIQEFEGAVRASAAPNPEVERAIRKVQVAAVAAIEQSTSASARGMSRFSGPNVVEDVRSVGIVLKNRETLDTFNSRIPANIRNLADSQLTSVQEAINVAILKAAPTLPFVLSLLMQHLAAPWQIIRLAVAMAGSDDELRVVATPYGIAVTMTIQEVASRVERLRQDIRQGRLDELPRHLKMIHDGLRGLRAELDIRTESVWGRQLSAIRVEISNTLKSELEAVPRRVRRMLRQRSDKEILAGLQFDGSEIDNIAAMIDFVAICRNYAGELAINEVTLRTFSDLQQYTESVTDSLVDSLRVSEGGTRAFRQMQVEAAIRFCDVLFGQDYASLMRKAADMAIASERKNERKKANELKQTRAAS